jgi:hypothetical protein
MGASIKPIGETVKAAIEVHGTDELRRVEIVTAGRCAHDLPLTRGEDRFSTTIDLPVTRGSHYYLRITQADDERAWTSPVFID